MRQAFQAVKRNREAAGVDKRVRFQKAETKKGASVKISDLAEARHLR
jgi:hypothetical protein